MESQGLTASRRTLWWRLRLEPAWIAMSASASAIAAVTVFGGNVGSEGPQRVTRDRAAASVRPPTRRWQPPT